MESTQGLQAKVNPTESDILTRFPSLSRLSRVIAYCRRPLLNHRLRKNNRASKTGFLTTLVLSEARGVAIRLAQLSAFSKEIELCRAGKHVPKRLPRESKHPAILPKNSVLSRLFVRHSHCLSLHGGPTLTQSR